MHHVKTAQTHLLFSFGALLYATVGAPACGGDDASDAPNEEAGDGGTGANERSTGDSSSGGSSQDSSGSTHGEGAGSQGDSVYALVSQVLGDDSSFASYLALTDSLDEGALSLDDAIEIPGRALGVGPYEAGAIYVSQGSTISRYLLDGDALDTKDVKSVSFENYGIANIGEYAGQFQFVASDKAYFFDGSNAQLVVWDPDAMTLQRQIELDELVLEDSVLVFSPAPVRQADRVITFAGFRSSDNATIRSKAAVVVVDTKSDQTTVVTDDRCGYTLSGAEGPDGMIYLATEAYGSAVYRVNEDNAPPPCMLRFSLETMEFDPGFELNLPDLFDGKAAATLVGGPDGKTFLGVLDETAYGTIDETTVARALASAAAWQWTHVTLGDSPVAEQPAGPHTLGSVLALSLGESTYMPTFSMVAGGVSTTLLRVGPNGPEQGGLAVQGRVFSTVKLR